MGETIENFSNEIELKDNKINFLTDTIGIFHEETIKQKEKVTSTEILDKTDRLRKSSIELQKNTNKLTTKTTEIITEIICEQFFCFMFH